MKFDLNNQEKYSVLTIEEEKLTSALAPSFKTQILMLSKESKSLICDLKNVDYLDSAGLSCFLIADRIYNENSLSFVICNASDKVVNLIQLTKLDTVLTKIETLEESIDYILMENLEKNL